MRVEKLSEYDLRALGSELYNLAQKYSPRYATIIRNNSSDRGDPSVICVPYPNVSVDKLYELLTQHSGCEHCKVITEDLITLGEVRGLCENISGSDCDMLARPEFIEKTVNDECDGCPRRLWDIITEYLNTPQEQLSCSRAKAQEIGEEHIDIDQEIFGPLNPEECPHCAKIGDTLNTIYTISKCCNPSDNISTLVQGLEQTLINNTSNLVRLRLLNCIHNLVETFGTLDGWISIDIEDKKILFPYMESQEAVRLLNQQFKESLLPKYPRVLKLK